MSRLLPARIWRRAASILLLSALANLGNACADEFGWPAFPAPKNGRVSWVAQNMRYNNVPMQIRMMESSDEPGKIIAFYQKIWTEGDAKVGVMRLAPWTVLAQTRGSFHYTVETRAVKGGSESVLTVTRLPEMIEQAKRAKNGIATDIKKLGQGFPMMSGSKVQMDMESFDEGKQGRMIMHRNTFPVEDNALYLREKLLLQGWSRNKDNRSADDKSRVLMFHREHQELILTLSRNGSQTEIFSNQTEIK